jgi:hypothetical protein
MVYPPRRDMDYRDDYRVPDPYYPPPRPQYIEPPRREPPPARTNGRNQPSPLSQSVIFVGLPPHVTEDILRTFLEDMGAHIDSTQVFGVPAQNPRSHIAAR